MKILAARMPVRTLLWLSLGALISARAQADQTPAFPTNEQMRHLGAISDPQLSPSGASALVQITESPADGGKSHLWLIDVNGAAPRQLTFSPEADKHGEHSGQWMADGRSILFLAHRGEHSSLFSLPMDGGEAKLFDIKVPAIVDASKAADALPPAKADEAPPPAKADEAPPPAKAATGSHEEALEVDIESFSASPDGKWIAFSAHDPETPGEKKQKEAHADANWVDHDPHGVRLYLLEVATGKVTPTEVPIDVKALAWREQGDRLLALTEAPGNVSELGPAMAAWTVSMTDLPHAARLTEIPATVDQAVWSVDGQGIVFLAQAKRDAPPSYDDLYLDDLASKTVRNLSDGFAGSIVGNAPLQPLADGSILQPVEQGEDLKIGRFPPQAKAGGLPSLPVNAVSRVGTNLQRNGWLFLGSGGGHPTALYFARELSGPVRQLNTPALSPAPLKSVVPRRIQWKNQGLAIEGLLYLPPQAAAAKVPLIVEVHGGPLGDYIDNYSPFADFLVGHGWAVLRTNPRGSTGRGAAFAAANKNDLGGADYRDIMAGVDYLVKSAPIDASRMALMGYSYGGEMAGFVEGKTNRFKAIISGAPVIDQYSEYGTEEDSWYDRWYFGKPWEHASDAWRQSPLSGAGTARTPFLLLQGEADTTDPLGQAEEMYHALRQMGVRVDLVTYPRDDHGPLGRAIYGIPTTEAWHGFDARRRVEMFLERSFGKAN